MTKFCPSCGAQLEDAAAQFCKSCGAKIPEAGQQQQQNQQQQGFQKNAAGFIQNTKDETASIDPADIEANKVMGGLAYFIFFLPLIACPDSKYGRFHANQGLLLLITSAGLGFINTIVSIIFGLLFRSLFLWGVFNLLLWLVFSVVWIAVAVIGIVGLINGFTGKAKELPLIGKFRLIK